jgi:hypothetical protein
MTIAIKDAYLKFIAFGARLREKRRERERERDRK